MFALEVLGQLEANIEVTHLIRDVVVGRVGSGHLQDVPATRSRNTYKAQTDAPSYNETQQASLTP